MIEMSNRLFAAFIGPNWSSHYRRAFDRIEDGSQSGMTRSWNTAAATVPFWFVYRGLTSWSVIFFLILLVLCALYGIVFTFFSWMRHEFFWVPIIPAFLTVSILQGLTADTLLHRLALRTINKVRRNATDSALAIRQLSTRAPREPPGAYITHAILMTVGIPVWIVAVSVGTTMLTPQYSEPQNAYIALMRTALRDLVVMEENFFVEAARYTDDITRLRYTPPEGVLINVTAASDSGWSATASHAMIAQPCMIFVGRGATIDNAEEGIPLCP